MKVKNSILAAIVLSGASSISAQATLGDFKDMSGCWLMRDDAKQLQIREYWMPPEGTSILGMSRTIKSGKTSAYEYMRIEERKDGIYFISRPHENRDETEFKLVSKQGGRFVFENKEHDFPQRVIYMADRSGLTGRIEGSSNGKPLAVEFPMTRIKCE